MSKLYRDYDAAGLEAQYRLRARHSDIDDFYARWNARSEALRARADCQVDVAYGQKPGERLDVFPSRRSGAPVHVFIHGGYWQNLDKATHDFIGEPSLEAGHAFVALNYTLAPGATMDEIVDQNRRALAWVYHNAATFNGDPNRIFVSGHSAGGHLVAMMLATDWPQLASDLPSDLVAGACAISGLFDLEPIRLCFVNDKIGMDREAAQRNSPINQLPRRPTPLIVAVGGEETVDYLRQSAEFHDLLLAKGHPSRHLVVDGCHHFSVVERLGDADSSLTRSFFEMIDGSAPA